MTLQHFIAVLITVLLMYLGNLSIANDLSKESAVEVVTVNVKEADAKAITGALVGVGLRGAQVIVDYRDQYGRFYSAEELTSVNGIGQATVEENLSRNTLK